MLPICSAERVIALASLTLVFTTGCVSSSAQAQALIREAEAPLPRTQIGKGDNQHELETTPSRIPDEADLSGPVDRTTLAHVAIAHSPSLLAGARRVRALTESARAESSLPEPELTADIWQVPISRPWAIGDAQMIMLGISQSFPAPGVRGLREEAVAHEARAEAKAVLASARTLVRSVDHAFVDYVEATLRHRARLRHREVVQKMVELAKARFPAGGSLSDVTQAEVEFARAEIDVAAEERAIETARIRLNGLLSRDSSAPLGAPSIDEPSMVRLRDNEIVARAEAARPELEAAENRRKAQLLSAEASRREANVPSFSLGASYFPPSGMMREHGFGASVSMTLPWLSGAKKYGATAAEARAEAEAAELRGNRIRVKSDAATSAAIAKEAEQKYVLLGEKALPASLRAREAAEASYTTGRSDAIAWLLAARAVVDIQLELVMARASLDRALADLDFAAGVSLPREPLSTFAGADDAR